MKPTIADEYPLACFDSPPLVKMLAADYNKLRERAIRLEAASLRVADLESLPRIGPVMLAKIVQEAKDALK